MEAIDNVFRVYNKGNCNIKEITADSELIKISDEVLDDMDIEFNPTPAQAHEPFIKRSNRVLKESDALVIGKERPFYKLRWQSKKKARKTLTSFQFNETKNLKHQATQWLQRPFYGFFLW